MYLKKLQMRGFKSFADNTELEFGPGITAVVGPNGVGKSNISDAVLWAMGEQSYKTLRSTSSQDLIFAGSDDRRPLSMAEVSLTFDNSDGRLPTEYSEVTVARRIFRSGESEYLMNKSACLLRDIRELFLDTGAGSDAYSVVGQGELDQILSIRSEDRRELLEEVAGIRKYRVRRNEAHRKLERTEDNLTRVSDIVYELTSQREPLQKEAEKAREYKKIDEKLSEIELQLLAVDHTEHSQKRGKAANDAAVAKADHAKTKVRIEELEQQQSALREELKKQEQTIEKLRHAENEAQETLASQRQQHAVNQERLRAVDERLEAISDSIESSSKRAEKLSGQVVELEKTVEKHAAELREARDTVQTQQKAITEMETRRRESSRRITELQEERNETLQKVAALENEAAALEDLRKDLRERAQRLEKQQENLQTRIERLKGEKEKHTTRSEDIKRQLQEAVQKRQETAQMAERLQSALADHRHKREILADAISRLEERRNVLRELQAAYEGYPEGLRAVVRAAREGKLDGVQGVVGDLLEVPKRLDTALQAGLDDRLGWVITDDIDHAVAAVRYLRENNLGTVTFFPESATRSQSSGPRLSGVGGDCLGAACKLVGYPREFNRVFEIIMGDLLVFEDFDAARDGYQRFAGRYRCVAMTGEVVERNGAVRSGPEDVAGAQSFGRKRELETIEKRLGTLGTCLTDMWQREEELENVARRLSSDMQEADEAASQLRTASAEAEKEAGHLQSTLQAAKNALDENQADIKRLQDQLQQTTERHDDVVKKGKAGREKTAELKEKIEQQKEQTGSEDVLEQERSKLTELQVKAAEIRERLNSEKSNLQRTRDDLKQARDQHGSACKERERLQSERKQLQEKLQTAGSGTGQLKEKLDELQSRIAERTEQAAEIREQVGSVDVSLRKLSDNAQQQSERLHNAQIALTREEGRLENIVERLEDNYEMTPEEAAEHIQEDFDPVEGRRQAKLLRSQIRKLGHVNLSAINEYERLKSREDFLREQQQDLRQSRDELLQVIAEIDGAAEEAFMEAFGEVCKAFDALFQRLFDGGGTQLSLTDEENPLEAGVEIFVQVPGKKAQNLMALSGGERALVAIALLFAMLKVNPSPFCVLDEIDAALDDANTVRFTSVLEELAEDSQFIIITHNPRTMEVADRLHGVTMQQPGISRIISVRLEDAQRQAEQERAVTTAPAE